MESYSVGERRYLRFQLEHLQHGDFRIPKPSEGQYEPYYILSLNGETLVEHGHVDVINDDTLRLLFEPTKVGQNVLDIWYYVALNGGKEEGDEESEVETSVIEFRTVRMLLSVVR